MKMKRVHTHIMAIVGGLTFVAFSFQNCSRAKVSFDDVAKQQVLNDTSVFDNGAVTEPAVRDAGLNDETAAAPAAIAATPATFDTRLMDDNQTILMEELASVSRDPSTAGDGAQRLHDRMRDQMCARLTGLAATTCMGDPLLIQLNTQNPQPIELTAPENGVMFDLLGRRVNHNKVLTSWFANSSHENYFLVLPDANGQVNGIDELFGDATFGPDQRYSKQGFQALAKHDDNKDFIISSDDIVFSKLRLWKDTNLDGIAQSIEISTLAEKGIIAIDLKYDNRYVETDKYGNMTKFKSVVLMKDNSYSLMYDLWLRYIIK